MSYPRVPQVAATAVRRGFALIVSLLLLAFFLSIAAETQFGSTKAGRLFRLPEESHAQR